MSDAMDNTPAAGSDKKIIIIGIGGNGARIIRSFSHLPGSAVYDTAAIDTDRESLGISGAKSTIQAESDWTIKSGLGCGGDIMKGERAIARERSRITQMITGYDYIIVTGGLGGGTATGGIRTVASVAKGLAVPTLFLLTTPFSFESYTKRKNAEDCIGELLPILIRLRTRHLPKRPRKWQLRYSGRRKS